MMIEVDRAEKSEVVILSEIQKLAKEETYVLQKCGRDDSYIKKETSTVHILYLSD